MKPSEIFENAKRANTQLSEYIQKKAKDIAEEYQKTVEKVSTENSINDPSILFLTNIPAYLYCLSKEFMVISGRAMKLKAEKDLSQKTKRELGIKKEDSDVT